MIGTSLIEMIIISFRHNDAIQCLAYNPVTHQLASCAVSDFGNYFHCTAIFTYYTYQTFCECLKDIIYM